MSNAILLYEVKYIKKHLFLLLIFLFGAIMPVTSQHQVVTNKKDTLNCYLIDINDITNVAYCYDTEIDSVYVIPQSDIVSVSYNYYPPYLKIKKPLFAVSSEIGLSLAQYKQAFGNIETQPLLRESLKRGLNFAFDLYFFNRRPFGVVARYAHLRFSDYYLDSTNAKETFNSAGIGIAFGGINISKQLFFTGQILFNYLEYKTSGNIHSFYFSEKNSMWGVQLSSGINIHIIETTMLRFNVGLNVLSKSPAEINNVFKPAIGHINFGLGFIQFI